MLPALKTILNFKNSVYLDNGEKRIVSLMKKE